MRQALPKRMPGRQMKGARAFVYENHRWVMSHTAEGFRRTAESDFRELFVRNPIVAFRRPDGGFNTRAEVELLEEMLHMHLYRAVRDFEVLSDLAVGKTGGDAAEHFEFACRNAGVQQALR